MRSIGRDGSKKLNRAFGPRRNERRMMTYQFICSTCGNVFPVVYADPSRAPICCGKQMDAIPEEDENG
jgi:hypothetical protein